MPLGTSRRMTDESTDSTGVAVWKMSVAVRVALTVIGVSFAILAVESA